MRLARFLNLALLVGLLVGSALVWPELPDRLPVHFGLDGAPDRWARRTFLSWFGLPLIALALNLLLYGVAFLSSRSARYINLPDKDRLLRLPSERQQAVLIRVREGLELLCLPLTLVFCLIQVAAFRSAGGHDVGMIFVGVLLLTAVATPAMTIWMLLATQGEINRQVAAERRTGRAGGGAVRTGRRGG